MALSGYACSSVKVDRIEERYKYYSTHYPESRQQLEATDNQKPEASKSVQHTTVNRDSSFIAKATLYTSGTRILRDKGEFRMTPSRTGILVNDRLMASDTGGVYIRFATGERLITNKSASLYFGEHQDEAVYSLKLEKGAFYFRPRESGSRRFSIQIEDYLLESGSSAFIVRLNESGFLIGAFDGAVSIKGGEQESDLLVTAGRQVTVGGEGTISPPETLMPTLLKDFETEVHLDFKRSVSKSSIVKQALDDIAMANLHRGINRTPPRKKKPVALPDPNEEKPPYIAEINAYASGSSIVRKGESNAIRDAGNALLNQDELIVSDAGGVTVEFPDKTKLVVRKGSEIGFSFVASDENNTYTLNLKEGALYLRPRGISATKLLIQVNGVLIDTTTSGCIIHKTVTGIDVGAFDETIFIQSADGQNRIPLLSGQQIYIANDFEASEPHFLTPDILRHFEKEVQFDYKRSIAKKMIVRQTLDDIALANLHKEIPRRLRSVGENRVLRPRFITFRPIWFEKDPYFHNVWSLGWNWKSESSIAVAFGHGTGPTLGSISATQQDLRVYRLGGVFRRYFDNWLNISVSLQYSYLSGNLTFDDSDISGSNVAALSSHALSGHFSVGHRLVSDSGVIIGIDWIMVPLPLFESFSLDFSQNASGTAASNLSSEFSTSSPVLMETGNNAVLLFYVGYSF